MAAQTVHFMNSVSKSFAQALLAKLFKGQSKLSILPFATTKQTTGDDEGGIKWADLSFSGADELYTIKDSFTVTKADDTEEKIQIDQNKGQTIDTEITERGEMIIEGNVPCIATQICDVFYDNGATVPGTTPVLGQNGTAYTAKSYGLESKEVEVVMLIENANEDMGIAFARVKARLSPVFESGSPAYLHFRGTVLANTDKGGTQKDWAICNKYNPA